MTRDAATAVTPQCATYSLFRSFPCKRESSGMLRCRGETCPSPRPRGDERIVIAAATKILWAFLDQHSARNRVGTAAAVFAHLNEAAARSVDQIKQRVLWYHVLFR